MSLQATHPREIPVLDEIAEIGLRPLNPRIINEFESCDERTIVQAQHVLMSNGYRLESVDNSQPPLHAMKFRSPGTLWPLSVTLTYYALRPPLFTLVFLWRRIPIRYDLPCWAVSHLDSPGARKTEENFRNDFPGWRAHWVPWLKDSPLI